MGNNKYKKEKLEAVYVVQHEILPYKMRTDKPEQLAQALRRTFLRRNLQAGVSTDPDGDAVWIRR